MAVFNSSDGISYGLRRCSHPTDFPKTAGGVSEAEEDGNVGISDEYGWEEMMGSDCSGEVVAAVLVCYDAGKTGHVDMLSVIPEYMGLGLSSGLLRNSEYLLHEAGKSEMTMKVFLSRDFAAHDFEKLGYSVLRVDPWKEMKDVLKPEAYESWVWVTLCKSI